MAPVSLDSLLSALDVVERTPGRWTAPHLEAGHHRLFGGQLLAQAIAVAAATGAGKAVKSISALFPREGRTDRPAELIVEAPHDGRTFATRRISGEQDGRVFFAAGVSLHVPEGGLAHQAVRPDPEPPDRAEPAELSMIPWEVRIVGGADLADRGPGAASLAFWTRVGDRALPDDPAVHQALLAHATDLTLIGTALRPHDGYSQADAGSRLATAVTSHAVWFHQPFRLDDWCLVSQQSPIAAGGRAFGLGHVFDARGGLVASFAQEAMIRVLDQRQAGAR